ncbi:cation diffusion facilitator family transporter [Mucilaginibacter myungsuensis]|uniref:Cation transporter n=1 Tax=Mucilaginibacter myungsuensis TaxID=649104 RepID=A0A929L3N8_9SPHI|nr:cation diffusion facilitator family transporter [Mucilaginibacter myungsuensis]MBE9663450.1 cation transporter [Mucilaginibacter myungsuensis]MDN3600188.1 cation diffusion facilitator family transporter [Mucilaginibacter myungsuensis]
MPHEHDHHGHDHSHAVKLDHLNAAFIWGIVLNMGFVVVEAAAGFITNSLSLLTDAGHNLSDVASLALALMAFKLAKVKSNKRYTYGYKRSTIFVSFFNALILLVAVGFIAYEAVIRFGHPEPMEGCTIAWVAFVGIGINGFTAWLFMKDKDRDLNVKGAYLHMAVDAIVSLGVVVAGLIIKFTGWYWVDGAVSLIIVIVIIGGTWGLLKNSLRLEMDGVPVDIELETIKTELLKVDGIVGVEHVHVWALSTTEIALTAHVRIASSDLHAFDKIKHDLRHKMEHLGITHCTFEPEPPNPLKGE